MHERKINHEKPHDEANHHAEIVEDQILQEMAEREEGEFNQQEELIDDLDHGPRSSKTRRG